MRGKRRSQSQLVRDRRIIADLYLQGKTQVAIAEEISVDQSTVSRDLAVLQKEWIVSALVDIDAAKAQELAKVDRLEREYWSAWERSCEDAETLRQEGSGEKPSKIVKTSKGQAGDPRFLQGVQWCIERRCKIIGIDAPEKHDLRTDNTFHVVHDQDTPADEA